MGNLSEDFPVRVSLAVKKPAQIRHNALEAARIASNRYIWKTQNDWQTLGTRVYDFPLPTEILGKESVSIRLTPRNNKAAEKAEDSYDSSTIANNSGYNTMDYFAVRYNK